MGVPSHPVPCWTVTASGEPLDALQLGSRAQLPPGTGEVSVRVLAAGINFLDVVACRGQYPNQPEPPFTIGVELVGEVLESGAGVAALPRSRLMGIAPLPLGALAGQLTLPSALLHPVPPGLDPLIAAALPVSYQTAHFALHRLGRLRAGEALLVHAGAGGLGTACIQLGVAAGAFVVAAAGGKEKAARCLAQGASFAVDLEHQELAMAVLGATDGRGADLVVDSVGGAAFEQSLACVAFEGRILVVGFSSGSIESLPLDRLFRRNATVTGLSWGEHYPRLNPELTSAVYDELLALLGSGAISPSIEVVGFDAVPDALSRLAGRRTTGKLVCDVAR